MPAGFDYPTSPHCRRHGPEGYADYRSYHPWLRDEFTFRCVYCLKREQWGLRRGTFDLDHFEPACVDPEKREDYDNLVYSCHACNLDKSNQRCPDPECVLTAEQVIVHDDGAIEGLTEEANRLIQMLDLDDEDYRDWREMTIRILKLARERDPGLYLQLMGFPDDLPDLSRRRRRPPNNTRPEGIEESSFAKREREELPETY